MNLQRFSIAIFSICLLIAILLFISVQSEQHTVTDTPVSGILPDVVRTSLQALEDQEKIWVNINEYQVELEVARTSKFHQLGLMFRTKLEPNQGMLFIFNNESNRSFWMRNTFVPLDIIFLDADLNIVKIHTNTIPNQIDQRYSSDVPVQFAIELLAGSAEKIGMNEGDNLTDELNVLL